MLGKTEWTSKDVLKIKGFFLKKKIAFQMLNQGGKISFICTL